MSGNGAGRDTVYSREQFETNYPEGIELNFWNLARNRLIVDTVFRTCGPRARVLDVGCGSGIVVEALRKAGLNAEGAELGRPEVKPALRDFVHTGEDPFSWPEERRSRYDVVMACDVIEHVSEPVEFLRAIRNGFSRARFCLVTVPARQELWTNYDEAYGHFLRYDRARLRDQMSAAGMEVVSIRYAFHGLYPVMGLLKLVGSKRTTDFTPPKRRWFEGLVAAYFTLERRLLPGFVPGTSVIAVASLR